MVGPSILQAPIVEEEQRIRDAFLPGPGRWSDDRGEWFTPGRYRVEADRAETPIYFREGSLIPMQIEVAADGRVDLNRIEVHVFASQRWTGTTEIRYRADDGITFDYRNGKRSEVVIRAESKDGKLSLSSTIAGEGFGPISVEFVVHDEFTSYELNGASAEPLADRFNFTGRSYPTVRIR
jgi:alpha-glucosidase (family GH31 glycosyl hydrolase)